MKKPDKQKIKEEFKPVKRSDFTSLGFAAYVLMIIITCITALALIPMAWCIPMTISVKRNYVKYKKPCSVGLMVCALLFMGLIPGILLLVDEHNKR